MKKNTIKYWFAVVLCMILISQLLSGCDNQPGEITTAPVTDTAPAVTTEQTTEEITIEQPPETTKEPVSTTEPPETDPPPPETADVFVHGWGGHTEKYSIVIGEFLPENAFESAPLPPDSADVKTILAGWEYSEDENGERRPYDMSAPVPVPKEGMHLYQVFKYSFLVRFSAGEGEFQRGMETYFYFPAESIIKPSDILAEMPTKPEDDKYEYIFLGFMHGVRGYRADEEIKVTEPMELIAAFDLSELKYTVKARTEYGELTGGGKTSEFVGTLAQAEAFVSSYDNYSSDRVVENGMPYRYISYELVKEGREWTLELIWMPEKLYTVEFITEVGAFSDGSKKIVLQGYYGYPLTVPEIVPPTFDNVEFEFCGWNGELTETIVGDAVYTAVFKTPSPVYYLNYYINGNFWQSIPYYEDAEIMYVVPDDAKGKIFSGWKDIPDFMPGENVDVYAEIRAAFVVYRLDGAEISRTETEVGALVTLAAPAQKYGHAVSGWTTADIASLESGGFTMPEKDVFFDAVSTPNKHKIIYILDGKELYVDEVSFGDTYTVRGIEVKRGCEFTGWILYETGIDIEGGSFTVPDADIVFAGKFENLSYNVNYYLDGMLVYSDIYRYGDMVTLRPNEVQEGCTFAWTSAGANISSGSFLMPAGDVDIYGAFSDGENRAVFVVDGEEYGVLGVVAGRMVDIPLWPTKHGYTFSGWQCDQVDVSSGQFIMPEGEILIRGSFIPNTYTVSVIDVATGYVVGTSYLDYGTRFSFADSVFCHEGKVGAGLVLIEGDAILEGNEYIMPDSDVIFGIIWQECLTLMLEEDYYVPYFALLYEEYEGCRYDEAAKTVYISDHAITVAGKSEGITVVYE